jgi:hypothetical protein
MATGLDGTTVPVWDEGYKEAMCGTLRREPVVTKGEEKVLMRRGFCAVVRRPADCMGSAVG